MLSAIVLAAGSSSRMGTDNKLLLPYKNKTVVENVVENILGADLKDVVVVIGYESEQVKHALHKLPVQFAYNPRFAEGMTSSIRQGVETAKGNGYMICLSDMVRITAAEYKFLSHAFDQRILADIKCICLPQFKKEKGNPVIFSAFYKEAILQNQEPEGCKNIVQSYSEHIFMVDMETPHILQDFDYPEDYKKISDF